MNRKRMKRHCSRTHSFHNGKRAKPTKTMANWQSPLLTIAKSQISRVHETSKSAGANPPPSTTVALSICKSCIPASTASTAAAAIAHLLRGGRRRNPPPPPWRSCVPRSATSTFCGDGGLIFIARRDLLCRPGDTRSASCCCSSQSHLDIYGNWQGRACAAGIEGQFRSGSLNGEHPLESTTSLHAVTT